MGHEKDPGNSDSTAVPAVAVITLLWLVGLAFTLLQREQLSSDGRGWWIWTAAAGLLTGILALAALSRRARRLTRD